MSLLRTGAIYVEILIRAPMDRIWDLTQDPEQHVRWDDRFSAIVPIGELPDGGWRFRYERRLPLRVIRGTGTSLGERSGVHGTTSALKFSTRDPLSPMGAGRGYWRYVPADDGVRFITGYDYAPAWGRFVDGLLVRRLLIWMTAVSFDRLRIWAESGEEPERWPLWKTVLSRHPERPAAHRCRLRPPRAGAMQAAPASLGELAEP